MRRVGVLCQWTALLTCLALAGCGGRGKGSADDSALTFERLPGSSRYANDGPILDRFDAFRLPGGPLRVKARVRLPEGTRVQVAIKSGPDRTTLASVNALVLSGEIVSPPMVGAQGPLPVARYVFEISAQFTPGWQSPEVLRATDDGGSLRGPGTLRTNGGGAMVLLIEEMKR